MPTLRLIQTALTDDRYHIELQLIEETRIPRPATVDVRCELSDQGREELRWYLETPQSPFDPHPEMVARIERRMETVGCDFFNQLFAAPNTQRLWGRICDRLPDTRVEISTPVAEALRGGLRHRPH